MELDIKLKLLLGKPILVDGIGEIYPLTIDEINSIGLLKYYHYIHVLTYKLEEVEKPEEMFFIFCLVPDFRNFFIEAISLFLKNNIVFDKEKGLFVVSNNNFITRDNFLNLIEIIKIQNGIENKEEEVKAGNDKVKDMMKKFASLREKYKRNNENDGTDIIDIISSVCSKHPSINLINVGSLTIYQLLDQFKRLNMIENYQLNFHALIHGASGEDIQLKHWSSSVF